MQEPRSTSTLELVVNEQQLQNMSQIDLSRPSDSNNNSNSNNLNRTNQNQASEEDGFSFESLRKWPTRLRESFNAKVDEAKANSETKTEFVFGLLNAFSGTLIWLICFVCTIIIPVILFLVGLFNLDNCLDRPALPYLVFATGFVMTFSNLFNLALTFDLPVLTNHQILTVEIKNTITSILNMIFNCVVAFLYILTAYMVFSFEEGNQDDPMKCNGLLYYFTFWFITLTLSLFVVLILFASILFAYNRYRLAIIRGSMPRSQNTSTNLNANPNTNTNPNVYVSNRV